MARRYKKNRVSRKGKKPYDIYLEKRKKLQDEGYSLRPALSEEDFYTAYENAKKAHINNFMRDLPRYERYANKPEFYRMRRKIRELDLNDPVQADVYNQYYDLTFEEMKKWNNQDWTMFREDYLVAGGTFEEFRGIYES